MWTEAADSITLESRIWPRSGAIAEKLWSSSELTDDSSDMYRRLLRLNEFLETIGLRHMSYRESLFISRIEESYRVPLNHLIDVLQEDLLFNRMAIYDPPFDVETPLNRVVDAAAPESYTAIRFERKVDKFLETKEEGLKEEIREQLEIWASIQEKLEPAIELYPFLKEMEPHAYHLSRLAGLALLMLDKSGESHASAAELNALLVDARKAYGGTLLSVVSGLERILKETDQKAGG
jgi:hexosaminidase